MSLAQLSYPHGTSRHALVCYMTHKLMVIDNHTDAEMFKQLSITSAGSQHKYDQIKNVVNNEQYWIALKTFYQTLKAKN